MGGAAVGGAISAVANALASKLGSERILTWGAKKDSCEDLLADYIEAVSVWKTKYESLQEQLRRDDCDFKLRYPFLKDAPDNFPFVMTEEIVSGTVQARTRVPITEYCSFNW